jgi:hypothetical protein
MTHQTHAKSLLFPLTNALFVIVPLVLVSPAKAFGYADPGTGAFLYQAGYAIFLGSTFYLRRLLDRVFRKRR